MRVPSGAAGMDGAAAAYNGDKERVMSMIRIFLAGAALSATLALGGCAIYEPAYPPPRPVYQPAYVYPAYPVYPVYPAYGSVVVGGWRYRHWR
jgi:hypothetical protein